MRIAPILSCAALFSFACATRAAQQAQVLALTPGTAVKPEPSDFDPAKLETDRFALGPELEVPQLTFLPAPASARPATSIILCAGGAYFGERLDKEAYKPALWLNSIGISAFVLRYRLPHGEGGRGVVPPPLEDVQRAVALVRSNASTWNLDPDRIGVMGWSAGGHLAAMSGTLFHEKAPGRDASDRPDFLVLMYPVTTMRDATHKDTRKNLLGDNPAESALHLYSADEQVTARTPPTFIAVARDDTGVRLENSLQFAQALKAAGVPCDLEIYEHGGHGFGLGEPGTDSMQWPKAFEAWATRQGLLSAKQRGGSLSGCGLP